MIPSLVAGEIRSALVDYLATTFSLADDDVRESLAEFLTDERHGIFRGPYVRVRTPFRAVNNDWDSPLGWLPDWFVPYEHQAAAFERLSTAAGRVPQPTLVTTGTGSGKTECFLMPALDHCARARDAGQRGIKALILYPMNALASDQAGRLAELISSERRLAGLRAGIYIGENGSHTAMGDDHLIDDRHSLRADPPDILLTNYKMLDFLLLRREDHDLWATNSPDTLQFVVLDEFHTYDGAQGTDVAMLLRRLGAMLGMASPDQPLGGAAPVATSATMGNDSGSGDLRDFAEKVFGVPFDSDAVIGETRQDIDEACRPVDHRLPVPELAELAESDGEDVEATVAAFCQRSADEPLPSDPIELGERLLEHPVTRALLDAVAERPRSMQQAASEVAALVPEWSDAGIDDPALVADALARYLSMLSVARRTVGGREVPLFAVEVQLWIREVSRLLRSVQTDPAFRWMDTPGAAAISEPDSDIPTDAPTGLPTVDLPAVSCRRCGHSGWMAVASELHDILSFNPAATYRAAFDRSPLTRVLMRAHPEDPAVRWLDPVAQRILDAPGQDTVPVHVTADEESARRQTCPACGERNAVLFIGLAVASLASVSINTLFGSPSVEPEERKLLAFTDSVQDASHRASFFTGRTHRFNMRSLMSAALQEAGEDGTTVAELGEDLIAAASGPHERYELVPPDLLRDVGLRSVWTENPEPEALEILGLRTGFEVDLEFGLRARVGRTLEQSVAAVGWADLGDADELAELVAEALRDVLGEVPEHAAGGLDDYLLGLGDRLRTSGAIHHELLEPYVREGGKQWFVWGGRPAGLPPFTPDQGRPTFTTTATGGDFDSVTALSTTPTWWVDWAQRTLGLDAPDARSTNERVMAILANATDGLVAVKSAGGSTVYGLDRRAVRAVDIAEVDRSPDTAVVRCDLCGGAHTVAPQLLDRWSGVPCRRYRCPGHYSVQPSNSSGYYRRFYRQGRTRRVVAGEHTGLLGRRDREALEAAFKDGTAPDAPNVLTATPTLEMGIDIGDLSAVMLTSVPRNPASYIQRVGRAGRATGNALVTTFVRSDSHGLYYLAEPEAMLAGAVRPPDCYLEAGETLERQFVAYLMDRIADGGLQANPLGGRIGDVMKAARDEGGLFRVIIEASMSDPGHVAAFTALFGDHLGKETVEHLAAFASGGIEARLKDAADEWFDQRREFDLRRDRLNAAIKRLEEEPSPSEDEIEELHSLLGQRSAVVALLRNHRNEYPLAALERLGVLPNYTLVDDAVTLSATLWSRPRGDEGAFHTESLEYARPGRIAIREFAPGNTFYAGGHRHYIDALEIGSAQEPLYETWRICPDCAYADIEPAEQAPTTCPRCGGATIADVGSQHTVLRLRTALASGAEEAARVYDENDDRTRERYETASLVDVDPTDVRGAWLFEDSTFGAELVTRARLRTFNLGITERPGAQVAMAGLERHVSRFTVCRHCGAVRDVREDRRGERPERLHQGWCKVRSGSMAAQWDPLVLLHELTTEAIRFLVPVSMYEVEERLASFKGALMLGIRATLGGNPDHLTVTTADAPNRGGQGRRRFLVLYDQVPGGTGYLGPLADPVHIHQILTAARDEIARCPCRNEGRPACHRCLLGVVDRSDYELVRRDLARDLLDGLLEDWTEPAVVPTVAGASIALVEESELERRFKVALREWSEREQQAEVTWTRVPGRGRYEAFELAIGFGGDVVRYRFSEQAGLSNIASTLPDFVIKRMDATAPEIAVYLDGFQYHASPEHNEIAADARKRDDVRASGRLVWNLTWDDVEQFHKAVTAEVPREAPDRSLLDGRARTAAQRIQHGRAGLFDVSAIEQNPVALLLDFLVRPDLEQWRRTVLSAVGGLAASAGVTSLDASGLARVLEESLGAEWPETVSEPEGPVVAQVARAVTPGGLPLTLFLDATQPNQERWTALAVLDDSSDAVAAPTHAARWADWLPWANLLQFLGPPHSSIAGIIAGASQSASTDHDDLWLRQLTGQGVDTVSGAAPEPQPAAPTASVIDDGQLEELDLMDPDVAALARTALEAGASEVVAGHEPPSGTPVEAAWPEQRVGILLPGQNAPEGWDARFIADWSPLDLAKALGIDHDEVST